MKHVWWIVVLLAGAARAAQSFTSGDGHEYSVTCNKNGYVLTSLYPVSRFVGQGADTRVEKQIETIYFGKSCDAFTEVLGEGTWGWANGGFGADFADGQIRFPRQELQCGTDVPDALECRW